MLLQLASQTYNEDLLIKEACKKDIKESQFDEIKQFENHFLSSSFSNNKIYYRCKITTPSMFFPDETFEFIYEWLPSSLKIQDPFLQFNSESQGYNMTMFLNYMCSLSGPTMLVMKSSDKIFGAFVDCKWIYHPTVFVGGPDSFLFSITPQLEKYECQIKLCEETGTPLNILLVGKNSFSFGLTNLGPALYVNEEWEALSQTTPIFNNPPFSNFDADHKFEILAYEVWTFG